MLRDSLGDRMKGYESVSKTRLVTRMPVIIRLDGCHFHTFTRGFEKPFDNVLVKTMQGTMQYLCENIQGCVFGYTQSDEITLVLCDYQTINTCAWYDNEVQKICSVAASMATMIFNRFFMKYVLLYVHENVVKFGEEPTGKLYESYQNALKNGATFDARCFNVPESDVVNCVLWRQKDAERNSIQSLGQHYFSQKQLHGKSCNMIQDMLHEEQGINWNDVDTHLKRGSACIKNEEGKWFVDLEMPILTQDRNYLEKLIHFED